MPRFLLSCFGLLLLASLLQAQSLIQLNLPPCAEPGSSVILGVDVQLEEGARLKSYDIRLQFSSESVTVREDLIQQGSLFPSGGPTFFWTDLEDGLLIVNAAILGPGLYVEEDGRLFQLPLELDNTLVEDIQVSYHVLYDDTAQIMPSMAIPGAIQSPCTDLQLRIGYHPGLDEIQLEWDPQPWTQSYLLDFRPVPQGEWAQLTELAQTSWTTSAMQPGTLFRVRARFVDLP